MLGRSGAERGQTRDVAAAPLRGALRHASDQPATDLVLVEHHPDGPTVAR